MDKHTTGIESRYGAHCADGTTNFRLWAPSAESVSVWTSVNGSSAMHALADDWFELSLPCHAGARYRFEAVCGGKKLSFPDPASHAQDDKVDGASVVIDHSGFPWQNTAWTGRPWHETVIYELHVGLHDGFAAMEKQLVRLAQLGVTAVELMPVAGFPGDRSWGYDGVLLFAPDAAYGTPDQLKSLVDTAHGLGMSVFLDVVYNHFGPQGNFLPSYASKFFCSDEQTPWGDAIDFRRREVRDFFTACSIHWLKHYRFDGLRFDAVHAIKQVDWLPETAQAIRAAIASEFGPERHVHLMLENDDNRASLIGFPANDAGFNAQWNDDWHNVMHVLLTNEKEGYYQAFLDQPAEKLATSLAEGFIYQGQSSVNKDGAPRGEASAHLPPSAFINFLQNHDQTGNRAFGDRLTSLTDHRALKAAQALLLLSPGIPLLFMGEESGSTQPFLFFTGYEDEEMAEAVRDGRRKEFENFESFSDESVLATIPDPNDVQTFHASKPAIDDHSTARQWCEWTQRLLALRRDAIVPGIEGASALGAIAIGERAVSAQWKLGNGKTLTLLCNLAAEDIRVSLDVSLPDSLGEVVLDTGGVLEGLYDKLLPGYGLLASLK